MVYTPKTEEQLAEESLLPDNIYDFEIVETSDKPSKAGSDMFTFKLHIFGEEKKVIIYDCIALGNHFGERKLRHAADACQLLDIYSAGTLKASDFQGKTGKVNIKSAPGNAQYPLPKNVVSDYVKREPGTFVKQPMPKEIEEDSVPF